jgi:ammonia channel protein AmtB
LIGLAYSWFALGEPDASWTARSAAAGWVAALAALPWMTPLQAMLVGAVAAWLFILARWLISDLLNWYDPGDIFAAFGLPAAWGLLAVGFFAPAPGQFKAQIIGVASIFLLTFFIASIFLALLLVLGRLTGDREQSIPQPDPDPEPVDS